MKYACVFYVVIAYIGATAGSGNIACSVLNAVMHVVGFAVISQPYIPPPIDK